MSYHTQKGYQKSTTRVFIMVVSALVGLGLGYVLFKSYRLYQERDFWKMDQFVFTVTTQFDQYQSAVLGLIDNSLNYPSCKPAQCLVNAKQQQKKLIDVLNEATKRYHNVRLTAVITQFRQWQHQHNILHSTLSQATLSHWSMHFGDHQYAIYKVLREIVGFYNIDSRDAAKTMWLVPRAEQALKNHPDDPHLCTVMQHSLVNTDLGLLLSK